MPNLFDQLNSMLEPPERDPLGQELYDAGNNMENMYAGREPVPPQPRVNFSQAMAQGTPAAGPAFPEGARDEASPVELPTHIDQALQYLLYREGFKSRPYPDGPKHSIGFGTQTHPLTDKPVRPGDPPVDRDEGKMGVIAKLTEIDRTLIGPGFDILNPDQRSGVLSALYNLTTSAGNQLKARVSKAMLAGQPEVAEKAFGLYVKGRKSEGGPLEVIPGLVTRRSEEQAIFKGKPWNNLQKAIEEGLSKPIYVPKHRLPSSTHGKRG